MKKIIALLLCMLFALPLFTACGGNEEENEDKGAIIPVYLTSELTNFDPATVLNDEAGQKILGMIYSGLTYIDASGKLQRGLAKEWKITNKPDDGLYKLEITLKKTAWSDGRPVSADDIVFAWKRILEPAFQSEAAAMLMEIKNARAVKAGDMSIDDLGLYASDSSVVTIEFESLIDYDLFLEYCASPALVPLREDVVNKAADWASNPQIIISSGPFTVRTFIPATSMILERNIYYYRDIENEDKIAKYVTPYRLVVDFTKDAAAQLADFNNGVILYDGELPLSERAAYNDKVTLSETMSTATYYFNTAKAPFDNADVRRALSLALDRAEMANILTYAKPAGGFVAYGVNENSKKTEFRKSGDVLPAAADMAAAKDLISKSGVKAGSFTITIRQDHKDRALAEYAVAQWSQLGFKVDIKELGVEAYEYNEYDLFTDLYQEAFEKKDFDVIAVDKQAYSTDAFSELAPFAKNFSGGSIDLEGGNYDITPHITGYDSEAYNAKIEEVFAQKERAARATLLHEAEAILAQDMPVIPLVQYRNAYLISSELSKVTTDYFGVNSFQKTAYKNYISPEAVATAAAETTAAETTN